MILESGASGSARRSSARVRKQPDIYSSTPNSASSKRKRSNEEDVDAEAQEPYEQGSDDESPSEEEEPDEEEVREQRSRARKAKTTAPKKPAPKKAKTNGTTLAMRPAPSAAKPRKKATKKTKGVDVDEAAEAGGLYADIFADDVHMDTVAAKWLTSFTAHESQGLADLMTFILKCAGCNTAVTDHDIEDPDGVSNRLTDIQDEFQATAPTEYPLIAKGRAGSAFKQNMSSFLGAIIKSIAASGKLYSDAVLIDNIEVWFSTMSSAGNRAFRHTATVASLSVITALADVAKERAKAAADWQSQADKERAKARPNAGRVRDFDNRATEAADAQQFLIDRIRDWFEAVFIHRYRDVDPAIRRDCVVALTDWILIFPDYFFDGAHLRYLGWVLSDSVGATRGEVVKQLQRVYKEKDKLAGLQTFTERFRSRLVEIATADSESTVRASGIELLDLLRENELLEPDDIDALGRLIYDSDPRVRKAVAKFFAENVNDLYNSKIDDLGGEEGLEEALPELGEGNFETPRLEWLKVKCLAEMMVAYDTDEDLPSQIKRHRDGGLAIHTASPESRFTLAAEALYHKIDELKDWEALCGYLLFDHSTRRANGVASDPLSQLKHEFVLNEKEESILLEVISASVKHTIVDLAEKSNSTRSKLTKKQKEVLSEEQEEAARHLAGLIPKLLKKFGDVPSATAAVLRMDNLLNLPSLQELRQETVTYGAIFEDIRKQFMAHGTDEVLAPASEAIAHAKSYGELDELTEETVGILWEDVISNLAELINPDTIAVRGVSEEEELVALSNNLLRVTRLSQVSNCTVALEDSSVARSNEATGADYQGAIDYVIALIQRALPVVGTAVTANDAALEDEVASRAAEAALRYLEWKIQLIVTAAAASTFTEVPYAELEALATRRDQYVNNLDSVLQSRKAGDAVSVSIAKCMLELHTSAVVLKTIKLRPGMRDDWEVLVMDLHPSYVKSIMKVFSAAEKTYAALSNKKLEDPASTKVDEELDAEPIDEDPLSESESEEEDEPTQTQASQQRKETKLRKTVIAEKVLCELAGKMIFAIHAGVDDGSIQKRLERNKLKLGPNFKELLAYIDIGQMAKNAKSKSKSKPKSKPVANGVQPKSKPNPKSNAIVAEDEMDDEIDDADEEVETPGQAELMDDEVGDELEGAIDE